MGEVPCLLGKCLIVWGNAHSVGEVPIIQLLEKCLIILAQPKLAYLCFNPQNFPVIRF
jgi:hypothetical protein